MIKSKEPLYYQIYVDIRKKILSNKWKAHYKLPSEIELCKIYDVSRITLRKAIEELVNENLLEKIQGKGTFVLSRNAIEQKLESIYSISEGMENTGKDINTKILSVSKKHSRDIKTSEVSNYFPGEVIEISRLRLLDGNPVMLENNYFQYDRFNFMMDINWDGKKLYKTLENEHDVYIDEVNESFKACRLKAEESDLLETSQNMFGLKIRRLSYFGQDLVSFSQIVSKSDYLEFSVNLTR
ncbi:GntR family transcriptional regulator [Dolosigranulum savutiense]|uniref:GntR family transcriptional regulator n=1 Tax=Dolosigranulum savutiense TaxID=3110288 RepID=A0AB74TR00_9LACT